MSVIRADRNASSSDAERDEIEHSPPTMHNSRITSPREALCFTRKLRSSDVTNSYLLLDKVEAATLTPDPEVVMRYDEDGMYLEDVGDPFKVYDDLKNEYEMQIRVSCAHATALFCLKGDWDKFVQINEARRDEYVAFYRCRNDDNEYYHVIRFPDRMEIDQDRHISQKILSGDS